MPTFNELVDLSDWVDIEVSVEDFYEEMDSSEKKEMAKLLFESEYLPEDLATGGRGMDAIEFEEALSKLIRNYHSLTKTDTDTILALAKRF